jgi:hypothetical protein
MPKARAKRSSHFARTAALQPDRDADGQGIEFDSGAPGHYSAASSKVSEAAGAGATSIRSISSRMMRACSAG